MDKRFKIASKVLLLISVPIMLSYALEYGWHIQIFSLDSKTVVSYVHSFGIWAPLMYILALAATFILVPVPGVIIATSGGILFGFKIAVFYTTAGFLLGTSVNYYLAKILGRPFLVRLLTKDELLQLDAYSKHMGWQLIFFSWFIPGGVADIAAYAAGLMRIGYRKYIRFAIPAAFLLAILTSGAGAAFTVNPLFVTIFTILAVFGILIGFKAIFIYSGIKYLARKLNLKRR